MLDHHITAFPGPRPPLLPLISTSLPQAVSKVIWGPNVEPQQSYLIMHPLLLYSRRNPSREARACCTTETADYDMTISVMSTPVVETVEFEKYNEGVRYHRVSQDTGDTA